MAKKEPPKATPEPAPSKDAAKAPAKGAVKGATKAKNTKPKKPKSLLFQAIDDLLGVSKTKDVVEIEKEKMTTEEMKALKAYEEGVQKAIDLIAPAGMEIHSREIVLNELFARIILKKFHHICSPCPLAHNVLLCPGAWHVD